MLKWSCGVCVRGRRWATWSAWHSWTSRRTSWNSCRKRSPDSRNWPTSFSRRTTSSTCPRDSVSQSASQHAVANLQRIFINFIQTARKFGERFSEISFSVSLTVASLNKAGAKRELLDTVRARKLAYCGHTMRKQGSCLEKEIMQGTMPGARRRGRPRTAWMDNIKTWTGLPMEELVSMTKNRDKWRKYVHGVANPRIEDG